MQNISGIPFRKEGKKIQGKLLKSKGGWYVIQSRENTVMAIDFFNLRASDMFILLKRYGYEVQYRISSSGKIDPLVLQFFKEARVEFLKLAEDLKEITLKSPLLLCSIQGCDNERASRFICDECFNTEERRKNHAES